MNILKSQFKGVRVVNCITVRINHFLRFYIHIINQRIMTDTDGLIFNCPTFSTLAYHNHDFLY